MNSVGTLGVPVEYWVQAMTGERLAIGKVCIQIVDDGTFTAQGYGALPSLTNGIQIFNTRSGFKIDVTGPLVVKGVADWARFSSNYQLATFGSGANYFSMEWDLANQGNPYGLILEEGDRLGFRVRDDLSGLIGHYAVCHGTQLKENNPEWITAIV